MRVQNCRWQKSFCTLHTVFTFFDLQVKCPCHLTSLVICCAVVKLGHSGSFRVRVVVKTSLALFIYVLIHSRVKCTESVGRCRCTW